MNVVAIEVRYGEGEAAKFRALDYHFTLKPASARQVYEAIKELQYQCSEGNVPETALFKALVSLRLAVAEEIIESGSRLLEMEAELENSLYARCQACCKGLKHSYTQCGAPTARKLLVGLGRVYEAVGK